MSSASSNTTNVAEETNNEPSLAHTASEALHSVKAIAHHTLTIAGLEFRLAGISLALMIGLGIFAAVLLATTWVLILMAIYNMLVSWDLSSTMSLSILAIFALFGSLLVLMLMKAKSKNLTFAATRQALSSGSYNGKSD